MANCNSCRSCTGCENARTTTCVGALNALCRRPRNFPFFTGPCPAAPSTAGGCNNCNTCGCNNCNHCGCDNCNSCGCNSCGCDNCNTCGCNICGCDNCNTCGCDNCNTCGCNTCGCDNCGCNSCGCDNCGCNSCDPCDCDNCGYDNCDPCGCNSCHNHSICSGANCCTQCSHRCGCHCRACFGVFTANGPINLSAGGTINLTGRNVNTDCFTTSFGSIRIRRAGIYFAMVTADIPVGTCVDTTLRLELGNQALVPPELAIVTHSDCESHNFAGSTVFCAKAGELLKLSTLDALTIGQTTAQPVFTLTLIQIG